MTRRQPLQEVAALRRRIDELAASKRQRDRAETELRDSEELYRSLYDNTPVMMHSIDPKDGTLVSVNNNWLEVLGYERGKVIGRRSTDFLTPASRRYAIEVALPEFHKTGVAKDVEYQMVKKSGEVIDVLLSAVGHWEETGRMTRTQAFMVDVTERKRVEKDLRESEDRYRRLVEQDADAFFVTERDGAITDVNQRACDSLGYTREELLRLSLADIAVGMDPAKASGVIEKMEVGAPVTREGFHRRKDGTTFPIEARGGLIELDGRKVAFALVRDVTERKRAEETRRQLTVVQERTRLAREIHDTLAQSLTAMLMQLDAAARLLAHEPEAARRELEFTRRLAEETLEEARPSVWDLQPLAIESTSLATAVQREVDKSTGKDIDVSLAVEGTEPGSMDGSNKLVAFRMVQEALSNIRRHSHAKKAWVRLAYVPAGVRLRISAHISQMSRVGAS